MVVTLAELDLDLDAAEERRARVEDEPVDVRRELDTAEVGNAAVLVRLPDGEEKVAAEELDAHPAGRLALLGRRAAAEAALADAGMVRERLDPLLLGQGGEHLAGASERILLLGERLDEAASGLEEVGQLVHAQLPR